MADKLFESYAKQADKFIMKNYIKNPSSGNTDGSNQETSSNDGARSRERYRSNIPAADSNQLGFTGIKTPGRNKSKIRASSTTGTKKINKLRKQIRELNESKVYLAETKIKAAIDAHGSFSHVRKIRRSLIPML
jgi:hypothetical protein